MKHTFWISLFVMAMVLTACNPSPTATPIPPVLLDSPDTSESGLVKASGVAVPVREAHLSFVISGMVKEVTVKAGDQVRAGQELARLDTTTLEYDIVAAKAALTSAEINVEVQKRPRKKFNFDSFNFEQVALPGELILEAELQAEQKQFALEAAEAVLAQGTLLAPFDSTVNVVNIMPGEYVKISQVVLELVDLSNLQIETTDLSELDIAAVKIGQPASVFVEALSEKFPGTVTAISPIADIIGGDVVFKVTIKLDEQPEDLLWGMSADVEIDTR